MIGKLDISTILLIDKVIQDQLRRGFIEITPKHGPKPNRLHHLTFKAVHKESSTTPTRLVYRCDLAIRDSPSLNDCIESTPPELNDIPKIFIAFRFGKCAVISDIEKAFLSVLLHEDDRDCTRFFWLTNPHDPKSEFQTFRFRTVFFGATCSPFILSATIQKHLSLQEDSVSQKIEQCIYVDNIAASFASTESAVEFFRKSRELMAAGGFNLRAWSSNIDEVMSLAEQEQVSENENPVKVLGLYWDTKSDTIAYKQNVITYQNPATARSILQDISTFPYDPLGWSLPVTVRGKLLMQELHKSKIKWDSPLTSDQQKQWDAIYTELCKLESFQIPREYFEESFSTARAVHVFGDAGKRAYGSVAYVVSKDNSAIMIAKSRIAPLKTVEIPNLELLATLVTSRLAKYIHNILKTEFTPTLPIYIWTDSQIVLAWLTSKKSLKKFVERRVREIKNNVPDAYFGYIESENNPADLLTRGIGTEKLMTSDLWWNGPEILLNKSRWPKSQFSSLRDPIAEEDESEIVCTLVNNAEKNAMKDVIGMENYSSLYHLTKITSLCRRYVNNLLRKVRGEPGVFERISRKEQEDSLKFLIQISQSQAYSTEILQLQSGKSRTKSRKNELIRKLRLFMDDQLIHCGGRLHNAPMSKDSKFPILLHKTHHLTRLIIEDGHKRTLHSGQNSTVSYLRQKYWIPKIRETVKSILRKCQLCLKVVGKPYQAPPTGPLQKDRVSEAPPFTITGCDFGGPLYYRSPQGERKSWFCLFTCASTRAVHLELLPDTDTETFIESLRMFCSRRSQPRHMISDNGSTFECAAKNLYDFFRSPAVKNYLAYHNIEWTFIPKRGPWFGGFYERLIALTKNTIKKIVGRTRLTYRQLQALLTETEAVINDRPLTYISDDIRDDNPITPSMLINGRNIAPLPSDLEEDYDFADGDYGNEDEVTRRAALYSQKMTHVWKRWREEYLTALREVHNRTNADGTETSRIQVGDIVMVHDDCPRIKWKLAIVEGLIIGNDGYIRAADIKTNTGYHTNRPITKLYPLEVNHKVEKLPDPPVRHNNTNTDNKAEVQNTRPKRQSAIKARELLKNLIHEDRV